MTHEIKEYGGNLRIRITLENGKQYAINASNGAEWIEVSTIDGGMVIYPSVSNVIKISTD